MRLEVPSDLIDATDENGFSIVTSLKSAKNSDIFTKLSTHIRKKLSVQIEDQFEN